MLRTKPYNMRIRYAMQASKEFIRQLPRVIYFSIRQPWQPKIAPGTWDSS